MMVYRLQRINKILTGLTRFTMSISVAAMALLIMLSVIVRNLLGFSFQWIVDVNRLLFIWMCFIGLVYVSDNEQLIRFDIIEKHFSPLLHKIVNLLRYSASLILFGIMVKAGLDVSQFAKAQSFSTIPVSTSWLYLAVVAAGGLLVFQTSVKILVLLFPAAIEKGSGTRQVDRM
jgi:TRAP-type C4-dicarboxylate transport system permease small subunit